MVTVRFYGDLKQFGTSFKMDVETVPEALRALMTQIKGLREHIEKGQYKVKADGTFLTEQTLDVGLNTSLHITPVTAGAGKNLAAIGQIIVGVVMIVASFYTGGATAAAYFASGAGMILGGIAQLLTKLPKMDSMKDSDDLKSSSFSNLANMTAQGAPVPIIYGEMMVGSKVLSQGVRSIAISSGSNGWQNGSKYTWATLIEKLSKKSPKPVSNKYNLDTSNLKVISRNHVKTFVDVRGR